MLHSTVQRVQVAYTNTGGAVSLIFAVLSLVLFAFIGTAVDYSRWSNAQSHTGDALDSALLNAARTLQTSSSPESAIAVAEKTFLQNAKTKLRLANTKVNITVSADGTSLDGVASGSIRTPFLGLLHLAGLKVAATSKVGFGVGSGSAKGGSDLEISMMLDVTGSMCNGGSGPCTTGTKMDALKGAASDLVNIVLKSGHSSSAARIALVPFATNVRVGQTADSATEALIKKATNLNATWTGWYKECTAWSGSGTAPATSESGGTGSWTCTNEVPKHAVNWPIIPCLTDRTGSEEYTDNGPGSSTWLNANSGNRFPLSWDSSDTPIGASGDGQNSAGANYVYDYSADGICGEADPKNTMMPLTNDKAALLDRINGLVGYGATSGALGTQWAWFTLSPNWSTVWPSSSSAAGSYADTVPSGSNPAKLRKIAVLMTDGAYNAYRGWKDQDPVYVSNNAKQICANMKAQGIEIYTVGFDLDSLPAADKARAIDTLQSCGTDFSHFYEALDAEQLKQSFRDIAMQLAQIYIAR